MEKRQRAGERKVLAKYVPSIVKKGRELERAERGEEIRQMIVARTAAEEALERAHAEELKRHDERWQREEAKHGSARFWSGAATGLMVAGALVATGLAIYTNTIIAPTFDAASRSRFDQMAVEAITQERPPTTNEPRSESAP